LNAYADSSFVVSLYLTDEHSPEARRLVRLTNGLVLTPFHLAEWAYALTQHQHRGTLSAATAKRLQTQFSSHQAAGLLHPTSLPENAFERCADLAYRYGPKLGMRTLDTLHVACALELKAERFWTFDERQAKLAKAAGLKIS
jgi:predicted nucleic acid-binding protein